MLTLEEQRYTRIATSVADNAKPYGKKTIDCLLLETLVTVPHVKSASIFFIVKKHKMMFSKTENIRKTGS